MTKLYHIFLLFLLIFNFRVPLFHNSMIVSLLLSMPILLIKRGYLNKFLTLLKSKYFFRLLSMGVILIVWLFVFAKLQGVGDYSFIMRMIVLQIGIISVIIFLTVVHKYQKYNPNYILKLLFVIFAIQAVIQIGGLVNHNFFEFIQLFHNHNDARAVSEIAKFGGLRGGALAGDLFFSLSIAYGLILFLYIKFVIDKEYIKLIDVLFIVLYLIGMFTSARIGYAGGIIALIYFLTSRKVRWKSKFKSFFKIFIYLAVFLLVLYLITPQDIQDVIFNKLLPFAFEFIYTYINSGEFSTASTSHLAKDMFIYPSNIDTWILGDGRMIGTDGSYYMHTDAGYSRILFYGGVLAVVTFLIYQILFFPSTNSFSRDETFFAKNKLKTFILILFYVLLINIKGLALGIIISINLIIILSFLNVNSILENNNYADR